MMDGDKLRQLAIIDANINRVSEGMRVVEDWARFYIRNEDLTVEIRRMRHGLWGAVKDSYPEIIKGRDSGNDMFSDNSEAARELPEHIPRASFNRIKEGLRVLEEMGKLISSEASLVFKEMRFKTYELERGFYSEYSDKDS